MNIPRISLSSVPALSQPIGIFGSAGAAPANYRDGIVAIMVYVYDTDGEG